MRLTVTLWGVTSGAIFMNNQKIIEKSYILQMHLREKNPVLANALERATIPLLEYEKPLANASRQDLLRIKGIGTVSTDLLMRIIAGEHVYQIFRSVPVQRKRNNINLKI